MIWQRISRWVIVPLLVFSFIVVPIGKVYAQTNYTFGTEQVNTGSSANPSNKDAEDAAYNTLTEADEYTDTNETADSENVVTGTAGGDAFPDSLTSDDSSYRTYTEEDTGGEPPAGYMVYLYPTGDDSCNWDTVVPSGSHYAAVDETTVGGDGATSYVETGTNSDLDRFTMADMGDPGAGYTLDVRVFAVHYKGAPQPCNFELGIRISTTNYQGYSVNPSNGAYTNQSSDSWLINPATSSEWTYAAVNALTVYITTSDASPAVRCTQVGLAIYVNFTGAAEYELDAQITFSSISPSAQTTSMGVYIQYYLGGTFEPIVWHIWNYTSEAWREVGYLTELSETDTSTTLLGWADNCEMSSGGAVLVKFTDLGGGDADETILYVDMLQVRTVEQGYALDVELTATSVAEYGNITLRVKGYVDAEYLQVDVWNYTSAAYDTNKLQMSDTENTWQDELDLCDDHHRSGQSVKIRLVDVTAAASDTTKSSFYLDVVWVTHHNSAPVISNPIGDQYEEQDTFWSHDYAADDYDQDTLTWEMSTNGSAWLSINSETGVVSGTTPTTPGWFWVQVWANDTDDASDTDTFNIYIENDEPVITNPLGDQEENGNAYWSHDYSATDINTITWELSTNGSAWLSIDDETGVLSGTTPAAPGWFWVQVWANDSYGGSDTDTFNFYVVNGAPVISNDLGDQTEDIDTFWTHDYAATDPDSHTVTWEMSTNASEWLSIDSETGVVSGTTPSAPSSYWVQVWANDTYGGSDTDTFNFYVQEPGPEPPAGEDTVYTISIGLLMIIGIVAFLVAWLVLWALR